MRQAATCITLAATVLFSVAAPAHAIEPAASPAAAGPRSQDSDLKYSVTFPDGWVEMSADELKAHNDEMRRLQPKEEIRWVRGYTLGTGENMRAYALVHHKQVKMGRQEIEELANAVLGGGAQQGVKEAQEALKDVSRDITMDRPSFGRSDGTLTLPMRMVMNDGSVLRGLSLGRIGAEGLVMLNFYTSEADFAELRPQFTQTAGGLTFDAGHTYADAQARESGRGGRFVSFGVIGGIVGALIAAAVVNKKKKEKEAATIATAPAGSPPPKL